jgi:hypothetical protein
LRFARFFVRNFINEFFTNQFGSSEKPARLVAKPSGGCAWLKVINLFTQLVIFVFIFFSGNAAEIYRGRSCF